MNYFVVKTQILFYECLFKVFNDMFQERLCQNNAKYAVKNRWLETMSAMPIM